MNARELKRLGFEKKDLKGAYCYQTKRETYIGKFIITIQDNHIKLLSKKKTRFECLYIDIEVRTSDGKKVHLKSFDFSKNRLNKILSKFDLLED